MEKLDWQTPEQAKWQADYRRERMLQNRAIADGFSVWMVCSRKPCRRKSACLGPDPVACTRRLLWEGFDETQRLVFQLSLQLRSGGASPNDAWREAKRLVAAKREG